jgi:hypothetical protein
MDQSPGVGESIATVTHRDPVPSAMTSSLGWVWHQEREGPKGAVHLRLLAGALEGPLTVHIAWKALCDPALP